MAGAKRDPSSLVQSTNTTGRSVTTSCSRSVRSTSSAPITPSTPSNRPPRGCVSRCEPVMTGGSSSRRPGRRPKTFPISSTATGSAELLEPADEQVARSPVVVAQR